MDEVILCAFETISTNHVRFNNQRRYTPDQKIKIISTCINFGFDINHNDSEILFSIIKCYECDVLCFLIDNGINLTVKKNEALIIACNDVRSPMNESKLDIIKLLLSSGIDPSAYNNRVIRKLSYGIHANAVKILVENGADPFADDNVLFYDACLGNNLPLIKYLISIGLDFGNLKEVSKYFMCGNFELKRLFLINGYNPNTIHRDMSLLEIALNNDDIDQCKLLFEYGADIGYCYNIIEEKYNIFQLCNCSDEKRIQFIDLFMKHGLDIRGLFKTIENI